MKFIGLINNLDLLVFGRLLVWSIDGSAISFLLPDGDLEENSSLQHLGIICLFREWHSNHAFLRHSDDWPFSIFQAIYSCISYLEVLF